MKNNNLKIIKQIEKIRAKNNVNWMNILRLAFKHAPRESKNLMKKIIQEKLIFLYLIKMEIAQAHTIYKKMVKEHGKFLAQMIWALLEP